MAYAIPFTRKTYTVPDALIPGNSTSPHPVEFTLDPAGSTDVARIRGLVYGNVSLIAGADFAEGAQRSVVAGLDGARGVFVNTVVSIRNLTVPALMAHKVGIIEKLPVAPGTDQVDTLAQIPVVTGAQFDLVAPYLPAVAFMVAMQIGILTGDIDRQAEPRFFDSPSGSGKTGTSARTSTSVKGARKRPGRRGTAGR